MSRLSGIPINKSRTLMPNVLSRSEAGDREKALQEQIKSYMRDRDTPNMTGLMRAEGRAREEAEKYKRMYQEREAAAKNGPNSALLEQVAAKSKEIDRLAGMLEEREAVGSGDVLFSAPKHSCQSFAGHNDTL